MYIQYATLKGLHWAELSNAFIKQKLGYVIHKACIFKDVNKYETDQKDGILGEKQTNLNNKEKYVRHAETTYTNNPKQAQKGPKRTVADLAFFD